MQCRRLVILAVALVVGTSASVQAQAAPPKQAPAQQQPAAQKQPPAPNQDADASPAEPLVSNVFVETYLTQALQDIAMQAGVNILVDPGAQGFVTLELKDVPLEKALAMVLAPNGLTFVKLDDRTYLIGKPDPKSPIFHQLSQTERVRLGYVTADEAKRLLSDYYTPYVRFDAETNTAVITAAPDLLKRIREDLQRIDRPAPQVLIDAVVSEVSDEARRQLGLDWGVTFTPDDAGRNRKYEAGFNMLQQGVFNVALQLPYESLIANLRKMEDAGKASIRANPRLTVLDGQSAEIFVGEDRYFKIVTGSDATPFTRLEAINVGVTLNITPRVAPGGYVTLVVKPTVSDVTGQVGDDLPVVSRRQISTTVRVKDGETLALGGLVQDSEQTVTSKVPLLGDLPLLRFLFSSTRTQRAKSEVVVFITPHLLESPGP
ncbi:MAG: secretin and TonB N-terminal domain-containing protein [Limnochordaceae bacterium]|nr:secretin and TonB N-terminal domain-containing protein [Limnochordaceae bacterium]